MMTNQYIYSTTPTSRVKRRTTITTRVFDENENMIEERTEVEEEYEYVGNGYGYGSGTTPFITSIQNC